MTDHSDDSAETCVL